MTANESQVGGKHYLMKIQPWDFIAANGFGFLEGNVIKYISRYKAKGGLNDLLKAEQYLKKLIEISGGVPVVEEPAPAVPRKRGRPPKYGFKKDGTPRAKPGRKRK